MGFLYGKVVVDPPGHNRGRIGGHYFHTWCPSVRPSIQKTKRAATKTMREKNDHLLAVALWVLLYSPDLYEYTFEILCTSPF